MTSSPPHLLSGPALCHPAGTEHELAQTQGKHKQNLKSGDGEL